ncbi:hypothetical protein [Ectobacillus panaciterrae]|uniref:hypothetical protein n=1 Tax=Ectobacillus panaciterrae TaxID=363872 RepID=UPI000424B2AE|nr:hypothetical protein [Ectobacillus panaciterrae]
MAPISRKIKIVNNRGQTNLGNRHNLSPFSVSKERNGSGGANKAVILNGKRTGEAAIEPMSTESEASIDL